jgi:hypothetical protein
METIRSDSPLSPNNFAALSSQLQQLLSQKNCTPAECTLAIQKMFQAESNTDIVKMIQELPIKSCPRPLLLSNIPTVSKKLEAVQSYLSSLGYNHITDGTFFTVHKAHSYKLLNFLAQDMIKEGVPIRCLEAVVLAMRTLQYPIFNV